MGSNRTNQEIAIYTAEVITNLEEYLHYLVKDGDPNDKRADKIDQWIEAWTKYLKTESIFNPKSIPAFKRGSIVFANLGFNVGMEYGGLHYAIVLNKKDSRKNHLLHLLPLTSIKESTDLSNLKYYQLNLGNEIHNTLLNKSSSALEKVRIMQAEYQKHTDKVHDEIATINDLLINNKDLLTSLEEAISESSDENKDNLEDNSHKLQTYQKNNDFLKQKLLQLNQEMISLAEHQTKLNQQITYAEKIEQKIRAMKTGSIALLNQVTTISKQRLYEPTSKQSLFTDIVLSAETMDKIDEALKTIF